MGDCRAHRLFAVSVVGYRHALGRFLKAVRLIGIGCDAFAEAADVSERKQRPYLFGGVVVPGEDRHLMLGVAVPVAVDRFRCPVLVQDPDS